MSAERTVINELQNTTALVVLWKISKFSLQHHLKTAS